LAVIAFLLSRFTTEIYGRALIAIFLFAATGAYFGFVVMAAAGPIWTLAELIGVIVFGALALLGLHDSPWWPVAGCALHPLWDVILHYWGRGAHLRLNLMRSHVSLLIGWSPYTSLSPMGSDDSGSHTGGEVRRLLSQTQGRERGLRYRHCRLRIDR
jgi:hypothetical protein